MSDSADTPDDALTEDVTGRDFEAGRVAVLGLNAWAVLLVVPTLHAGPRGTSTLAWVALPAVALAVGVWSLGRQRRLARWVLLAGFPPLLASVVAGLPDLVVRPAHSTPGLVIGALSFAAYGAGATLAAGRPEGVRAGRRRPLGSVSPSVERPRRRWLRWTVLALGTAGAVVLAIIVPALGGPAAYERVWGRAAPEAAVLTAVVGGALASAVLAIFLGPMLRAARTRAPTRRQVRRRVGLLLVSVAMGLAFYVLYAARSTSP